MEQEQDFEDEAEDTPNTPKNQEARPVEPGSAVNATGFEPPANAVRARFRRLNRDSGGWEDAPVVIDGSRTAIVDANSATPNLPLVEQIPTNYRITWYNNRGKICGYSRVWNLGTSLERTGGVSNTPRKWPAGSPEASAVPGGTGFLSSADVLALMRGLSLVVHEAAAPMIAQVHLFAERSLERERAFYEARMGAETQRHNESLERDRAFMRAMRDVHEVPRDEKIRELTGKLSDLEAQAAQDAADAAADEENAPDQGAWDVAGKLVENAPDIIRTVMEEARGFGSEGAKKALPDVGPDDVS